MSTTQNMTQEQMQAEILRLQAEVKAQRQAQGGLTFRVSEKGAVSVYGMGRFPVTLYAEQWGRLAQALPQLQAFIEAHQGELKTKAEKLAEAAQLAKV